MQSELAIDPSQELEMQLLGSILQDNSTVYKLGDLEPRHFEFEPHDEIFQFMLDEIQSGREVTLVTLSKFLAGSKALEKPAAYIAQCYWSAGGNAAIPLLQYADQIIEGYRHRKMQMALDGSKEILREHGPSGVIAALEESAESERGLLIRFRSERELVEKIYNDMKRDLTAYSTGLKGLDLAMAGGLYCERSYCMAARMKQGKTMMLSTISQNLARQQVPHLFIACEMGSDQIYQRDIARGIGKNSLEFLGKTSEQFRKSVADYAFAIKGSRWFVDAPGVTFSELKKIILAGIKNKKVKGFVLDYLQLVGGREKGETDADHQAKVAQWIADICRKEKIFALYAAQINREGNIRGSDGIVMAADQVYHLQRKEGTSEAWLECIASRYTRQQDLGSEDFPSLLIDNQGPHFRDL